MVTLDEHIRNLFIKSGLNAAGTSEAEVYKCITVNENFMDEDSFLCWNIKREINYNVMNILFCEGDGAKIIKWIKSIAHKHRCKKVYAVTNRPKGVERKYGFKPLGTLMEMEV